MRFDYLVPFETIKAFQGKNALENLTSSNYYTYILLNPNVDPAELEAKLPEFLKKTKGEETAKQRLLRLQRLLDIHFNTGIAFDRTVRISRTNLVIFSCIAVFILLIACINFMNLSSARATLRAVEVGIRKVSGAKRLQLVFRFLSESVCAGLFAVVFALAPLNLFIPWISSLLGRYVRLELFSSITPVLVLFGTGILAGIAAGIYPAFVLSSFSPGSVMKGHSHRGMQSRFFRKALTVIQFAIAVFMLIALGTVYGQLSYVKKHDLGFDKEQIVQIHLTKNVKDQFDAFKQRLLANPEILNVTMVRGYPGHVNMKRSYKWPGDDRNEAETHRSLYTMLVDPSTLKTLDLQMVSGRFFSWETPTDEAQAYVLNESAVRELGFEEPIGQPFHAWTEEMGQIIGVVKDFHFQSLHYEMGPLVMDVHPEWCWTALVRIGSQGTKEAVTSIESEWRRLEPDMPYTYRFLDDMFEWLYRREERLGRLFTIFTFLALFVACLGIFGMVAFVADRRKREIGIRKVLGATVPQILVLISEDFSKLVLYAYLIAAPAAYWMMNQWLQNFSYRTNVNIPLILFVGVFTQLITLITISFQSIRAALANPVDSLKYE